MRVPYRWLSEYIEIPCDAYRLADALTMVGVKVESVLEDTLDIKGIVVGRIQQVQPHPHRSSLWVATVSVGDGQLQVVTGAPVTVGWCVAVAVPGAVLPGGWRIEAAPVAGIMSEGMLLSATELLYGEPHTEIEGLLRLPAEAEPGQALKSVFQLDDLVLELDLTPNYGHCLSILGVAQEVAAVLGGSVSWPWTEAILSLPVSAWPLDVQISAPDLCSRYVGKLIEEVQVAASPLEMQRRLQLAGMRPLNNVVDATNYTMLELGQPLHAFDYEQLHERIEARRARPDECLVTLDDKKRVLTEQDLVIADARGPIAIAGVMGGLDSEVTASTRQLLLESAHFSPLAVRRTATRLGLRSEASARFERGVDPLGQMVAAERCAFLLGQTAGARPKAGLCDRWVSQLQPLVVPLRAQRVNSLLGTTLPATEIEAILRRLGFDLQWQERNISWLVTVPTRRPDVSDEVDLVEEVARLHGYERIEPTLPKHTAPGYRTPRQRLQGAVREQLLGCGLDEALTHTLVDSQRIRKLRIADDDPLAQQLPLANPLSADQDVLRNALLPGLLDTLAFNRKRQVAGARVFEMGRVFAPARNERLQAAVCAYGPIHPPHWRWPNLQADFFYAKGILEALWDRLGLGKLEATASALRWLHPGRQAQAFVRGQLLASWGELHPEVAESWDLPLPTAVLEIDLEAALVLACGADRFEPLPRYPAAQRDLAILVPAETEAAQVERVIEEAGAPYLERVTLFDEYRGEQVADGYRSLAYTLVYRKKDGTLNEDEIVEAGRKVANALSSQIGAHIR